VGLLAGAVGTPLGARVIGTVVDADKAERKKRPGKPAAH